MKIDNLGVWRDYIIKQDDTLFEYDKKIRFVRSYRDSHSYKFWKCMKDKPWYKCIVQHRMTSPSCVEKYNYRFKSWSLNGRLICKSFNCGF